MRPPKTLIYVNELPSHFRISISYFLNLQFFNPAYPCSIVAISSQISEDINKSFKVFLFSLNSLFPLGQIFFSFKLSFELVSCFVFPPSSFSFSLLIFLKSLSSWVPFRFIKKN